MMQPEAQWPLRVTGKTHPVVICRAEAPGAPRNEPIEFCHLISFQGFSKIFKDFRGF
jgi:hypothetical protein